MECQECHKRPATMHFTKIVNGEKKEMHLCEQCAKEKGEYFPETNSYSIHHLLSGLLNLDYPMADPQSQPLAHETERRCEKCGMTYSQFIKTGKLGCAQCYNTFDEKLNPVLRKVHSGNTEHSGKVPKRGAQALQVKRQIKTLKQEMQQYIEDEAFEEAATIRDRIRELEKKNSHGDGDV